MTRRYEFIASEEGRYPVVLMCRWMKVSRSGYYEWVSRRPSKRDEWRSRLEALIGFVFSFSNGTYGYRRVHAQLVGWGHVVDDETVRQTMCELGLQPCQPRPWRPVTTVAGDADGLVDLLRRDFTSDAPGHKLVGDITYIRTGEGWLYLATVLDCFSKKVVGYAMADHLRTELITDGLEMACVTRR